MFFLNLSNYFGAPKRTFIVFRTPFPPNSSSFPKTGEIDIIIELFSCTILLLGPIAASASRFGSPLLEVGHYSAEGTDFLFGFFMSSVAGNRFSFLRFQTSQKPFVPIRALWTVYIILLGRCLTAKQLSNNFGKIAQLVVVCQILSQVV
jgi:hypothetical protein